MQYKFNYILLAGGMLSLFVFATLGIENLSPIFVICIIVSFLYFIKLENNKKTYKYNIKKDYLHKILAIFADMKWSTRNNERGGDVISDSMLRQSEIFPHFHERKTDDEFYGEYNGVKFKISEINLIVIGRGNCGRSKQSVFKGIAASFEFNKKINKKTIVTSKNSSDIFVLISLLILVGIPLFEVIFNKNYLGIINVISALLVVMPILLIFIFIKNYKKIKLEDADFNKEYNVLSEDEIEARYILTPSFMERLKKLKNNFKTNNISCSFMNNQIIFAIGCKKDMFEFGSIHDSLIETTAYKQIFNDLDSILGIIDCLKLDKKIGL